VPIGIDCHPLFTISEEVGSGASHVLHGEVAEMVAIDNAPPSAVQNATERDVTLAMMDSTGPFDFHLTRRLAGIAAEHGVPIVRDVFRYYRCDAASAIEAGNDIRTALLCFGADASHGYERTHIDGLVHLARLLALYVQSPPAVARDRVDLGPIEGFPEPSPGIPSQPEPNP
jgi:putative aminopeptidase FrvX